MEGAKKKRRGKTTILNANVFFNVKAIWREQRVSSAATVSILAISYEYRLALRVGRKGPGRTAFERLEGKGGGNEIRVKHHSHVTAVQQLFRFSSSLVFLIDGEPSL